MAASWDVRFEALVEGRFLERLSRFHAAVEVDGHRLLAHVPNSGRLRRRSGTAFGGGWSLELEHAVDGVLGLDASSWCSERTFVCMKGPPSRSSARQEVPMTSKC